MLLERLVGVVAVVVPLDIRRSTHRPVSAPHPSPLLLLISPPQWATLATHHSSVISRCRHNISNE